MLFLPGRRGVFALALLGSVAVATEAHAFCRTTTLPLPASYSPTRGCFTDGLFLYWRNTCVSFSINAQASRTIPFADAKRVIEGSFSTWIGAKCANGAPPGISVSSFGSASCDEVRYNPDKPNQNLIVFRDDGWPYQDPNSTLGLTTVTFNADTGEIFDADMEINSSGRNLSTTDQVPTNGFDLASVVTHEAGHFFGLAHATDSKATMFASYKPGTTALRSLADDDVAGVCAIYPTSTTRVVSPTKTQSAELAAETCDPSPRHGVGDACEEGVPKNTSSCSAAAGAHAPWIASVALVGLALGLVGLRRARSLA